jgi:uncharacterized protein
MDKNSNSLTIVFITGILLIAIILVLNQGQTKIVNTTAQQQNAISVSGNAKVEAEPDLAEIFIRIETFSSKAKDAKDENAKLSDSVRKALKKEGIKDDQIETTSFFLNPRYRYDRNKEENVLEGYSLTHVLKTKIEDIYDAGKLVDIAVDAGANGIDRVAFTLSKEKQKEISQQSLSRAAEVAEDKAKALANSLNVNLGSLLSVQESSFDFVAFDAAPRVMALEGSATQISPQNVEVSARVTVSYEIIS